MTEADITSQIVSLMDLTLTGVGVVFSIVSAYVVALYYFLHRAPILLRLTAFLFFTLIVVFLGLFTAGVFDHGTALHAALEEIAAQGMLSPVGKAVLARSTVGGGMIDTSLQLVVWAGFASVYISFAYLTFLHRWKTD